MPPVIAFATNSTLSRNRSISHTSDRSTQRRPDQVPHSPRSRVPAVDLTAFFVPVDLRELTLTEGADGRQAFVH